MFDIGLLEMGVILIVILLVVGPKRLPKVARSIGKWIAHWRRIQNGIDREIQSSTDQEEKQSDEK